jgi:hypothetical protein
MIYLPLFNGKYVEAGVNERDSVSFSQEISMIRDINNIKIL